VATIHGLTAGTDAGSILFVLAAAAATFAVGTLTFRRVREATQPPARRTGPSNPTRLPELVG